MCRKCADKKHHSTVVFFATNAGVGENGATTPVCPGVKPSVPSNNEIVMLKGHKCGYLKEVHREKTGGLGTGPGLTFCEDPLGSQQSIAISSNKKFLFVVNAGINDNKGPIGTVSSMKICHSKVKLIDNVSSGGVYPVSCATHGNLLYVLNAGAETNLTAYKINKHGKLQFLGVKATFNTIGMVDGQPGFLFELVKSPCQVSFNSDGSKLIVMVKEYNPLVDPVPRGTIYVFDVQCNGDLANMVKNTSTGYLPWNFSVHKNYIFGLEVIGNGPADTNPGGKAAVSSYLINDNNYLTPISNSVQNGQTASCWSTVHGKYLYVGNSRLVPGTITQYKIQDDGQIVLVNPVAYSSNTHILDMTSTNGYLYAVCPGALAVETGSVPTPGSIQVLKINKHTGNLSLVHTPVQFETLNGTQGIAAVKL